MKLLCINEIARTEQEVQIMLSFIFFSSYLIFCFLSFFSPLLFLRAGKMEKHLKAEVHPRKQWKKKTLWHISCNFVFLSKWNLPPPPKKNKTPTQKANENPPSFYSSCGYKVLAVGPSLPLERTLNFMVRSWNNQTGSGHARSHPPSHKCTKPLRYLTNTVPTIVVLRTCCSLSAEANEVLFLCFFKFQKSFFLSLSSCLKSYKYRKRFHHASV